MRFKTIAVLMSGFFVFGSTLAESSKYTKDELEWLNSMDLSPEELEVLMEFMVLMSDSDVKDDELSEWLMFVDQGFIFDQASQGGEK